MPRRRRQPKLSDHQTETQFQKAVIEYARARGWFVYHTYDSRRSAPGFPDLVMARKGEVVFAELKSQRGRLRPEQREWLEALATETAENVSHSVYIWRPDSWPELEQVLQ